MSTLLPNLLHRVLIFIKKAKKCIFEYVFLYYEAVALLHTLAVLHRLVDRL